MFYSRSPWLFAAALNSATRNACCVQDAAVSSMDHGFLEPGCGPPTAGKTKGARKGRRWSLDIISPFFQPRKRSTALLDPPDGVCTERRLSSSTLSPSSSGGSPVLALSFPWRRTPRTSEHDAFIVVHPRDGDSYVVSVVSVVSDLCCPGDSTASGSRGMSCQRAEAPSFCPLDYSQHLMWTCLVGCFVR